MMDGDETKPRPAGLFDNTHFRNLIIGGIISMTGDQFYLVALPWLVLELTGSNVALGTALMLAAFPRAILMLMGGAMSDRTSPQRVMIMTASTRAVLVAAIAALIWANKVQLWEVYLLSFAFGVADAFAIPAMSALLPALVQREQLTRANSVLQGSMQLTLIAGPPPAGVIIKKFGTLWAFLIDSISFLFIIAALWKIPDPPARSQQASRPGVWHSMMEGLHYVYADVAMRTILGFSTALNFCIMGPVMVGLAALAKERFGSATAYGSMFAAFAAGALGGSVIAGTRKQRNRGIMLLFVGGSLAILLALVGVLESLLSLCALMFLMGIISGYSNVHMTAWYQERVEPSMMGRVMSLRMFSIFGMMPISLALSGLLAEHSIPTLFISSGTLMLGVTLVAALQRPMREVD
jgi:MFS family permease